MAWQSQGLGALGEPGAVSHLKSSRELAQEVFVASSSEV